MIICSRYFARSVPINYILLGYITFSESYLLMMICSKYTPQSVFMVFLLTTSGFIGMTSFALLTKDEVGPMFIMKGMMYGMVVCTLTMITSLFFLSNPIGFMIYSLMGACLALIYVGVDTMLIFDGHKYGIEHDDYIKAALFIYLDMI